MKNTITEMKDTLEGINRLNDTEGWISELEDRVVENSWHFTEKRKKNEKKWVQLKRLLGQEEAH